MNLVEVKVKRISKDAVVPGYAKAGDAGMDLTAISMELVGMDQVRYNFGIAMEIPEGYVGLIFPRSSVYKQGGRLSNCVGVIDSGYRGEISAVFDLNRQDVQSRYRVGERIAQIIIMPYPTVVIEEVDELGESERGTGGFGSTGA